MTREPRPRVTITVELSDERMRVTDEEGRVHDEPAVFLGHWRLGERYNVRVITAGQRALDQAMPGALDRRQGPLPPGLDPLVLEHQRAHQEALTRPGIPSYEEGEGEILVWPLRDFAHDGDLIRVLLGWLIPGARGDKIDRTSIDLTRLPADLARRDAIVRACWRLVGAPFVTEDGQPSTLRLSSPSWYETQVTARLRRYLGERAGRRS